MVDLPAPSCVSAFLAQAERLGIAVRWQKEGMEGLDAAYEALPGVPGALLIKATDPPPSAHQLCTLLSHEMVHVLQHWHGALKATPPLGWPTHGAPQGQRLSIQQAEAYTAQRDPRRVLEAVRQLKPLPPPP